MLKIKVASFFSGTRCSKISNGYFVERLFCCWQKIVTRKPCYRKDDRAMHPIYKLFTLILFTLIRPLNFARILILNEFKLRGNFAYFCNSDVSAVQGHPRSLILVPIESAYATSY